MRRITMRYEDDIYYPIYKIAKENNKFFRDVVMEILSEYIYRDEDMKRYDLLNKGINECLNKLDSIKKKQNMQYDLSVQEFVNHGYLSNADPTESVSYQELLNKKNKFND